MPMTVEEYNIGQLYMIARHSCEQSNGEEGVEVIENAPYTDPVHGRGQFTEKRVHLSGKLPVWIRSYIPRFIYLTEKAWNYYPYTETGEIEVNCSVIPRFSVKIRTRYQNNNGTSDNCLSMEEEELKQRLVDHVDILTDPVDEKHYKKDEDLSLFKSEKTGRGPLREGWREAAEIIMCSYKLVDVSFQVFGLQTRVEDFVHRAIRNVLLLGHRQAFAWIDEWYGMTLEDVRLYESGMQEQTNEKIRLAQQNATEDGTDTSPSSEKSKEEDEEVEEEGKPGQSKGAPKKQGSLTSQGSSEAGKTSPTTPQRTGYLSSWFKWS
ncbi:hypothetical protein Pmani_012711 [Petrolisthes manimaculis]|uniref:Phosphatidylinositol transfer protein N-terminal domain-containing protein n=1 Tax=Petrolisthes manimaculis TaxID=1843537 RepID=A0AAE1PYI8_9EUCA|nr:hypothetical protein Pmani_012711 [Petrolisthes manimaculis]